MTGSERKTQRKEVRRGKERQRREIGTVGEGHMMADERSEMGNANLCLTYFLTFTAADDNRHELIRVQA